ncbi:hypothetical protein J2801_000726 [Paraburkholderia phenoliruptrix]|nr:hypothetical protein [Paraburkholderia phenoliruptrix]
MSSPRRARFMVAVLRYLLPGRSGLQFAARGMAIQAFGCAARFGLCFDVRGGQAVLEHQLANLVDCDLRFPCNKGVSLCLELLKLCLDLL